MMIDCTNNLLKWLSAFSYRIHKSYTTLEQEITYALHCIVKYYRNVRLKNVALELIRHMYALVHSIQSSDCLRLRNIANNQISMRSTYSLNTDLASSRLKLASILHCGGHLHAAKRVLEDVQRRYHSRVKAVCVCRRIEGGRDLQVFANMHSGNRDNVISESPFAFCVRFLRKESYCIPSILLFEMNRNATEEEVAQRTYLEKTWMDSAEIDACPFLYYLQYLTYGGLGQRDKQLYALGVLESYMSDIKNVNLYHPETALNLLGHCFEM
ncbi:hypothetical protein DPMN_046945 [Dreissena polymorpha]|uniref:Uncharacterized protein n=1 Tax=Dreissena polymorpha TaxID=45954 RepID=A0A9D4I107_DREPO|nr:hypothetical protein DPMN_046945 [Dreissena polymorpha]